MNTQFEIIGFLRRCLTQQAEIRGCLYDGFSEIYKTTKKCDDKRHYFRDLI